MNRLEAGGGARSRKRFARRVLGDGLVARLDVMACLFQAIAGDVKLDDHAVVHQSIDGGGRCHRVLEDPLASFVSLGQQREDHFHLFPVWRMQPRSSTTISS